jgi:hypothetical protein
MPIRLPIPYYKDPLVHDFIKNKKIICVGMKSNMQAPLIEIFKKKYNVIDTFTNTFKELPNGIQPSEVSGRIGAPGGKSKNLPQKICKPYLESMRNLSSPNVGTSGMAILYAKYILNKKNIFLLGIDFFEKPYYMKVFHTKKETPAPAEAETVEKIKHAWNLFFNFHHDITFYLYTLANWKYNIKNVLSDYKL